jgi:hypothetical protein
MQRLMSCLVISSGFILSSCGVSQTDYDKVKAENESLKSQLDELSHGENRLAAIIDKAYAEKNYPVARTNIELLSSMHPESEKNSHYKGMLGAIVKIEATEAAAKEVAEKERVRLANLNNTGMWQNTFYVDDFGEQTKDAFIRNAELISGSFSNTATQDSKLNVRLLIDGSAKMAIVLYEYAGNNPVKDVSTTAYTVRIKDRDGKKYELRATNGSDRLVLGSVDSGVLNQVLLKGGQIQFWLQNLGTPTTQYQFTIANADWYGNAYQKLVAKQ